MKKYFVSKVNKIVFITLGGAIVLTILSMFFYKEDLAFTLKQGKLNNIEASRMGIQTHEYHGWPSPIHTPKLVFVKYDSLIHTIFVNILGNALNTGSFLMTLLPNLVFWGAISLLVTAFIELIRYKQQKL